MCPYMASDIEPSEVLAGRDGGAVRGALVAGGLGGDIGVVWGLERRNTRIKGHVLVT